MESGVGWGEEMAAVGPKGGNNERRGGKAAAGELSV